MVKVSKLENIMSKHVLTSTFYTPKSSESCRFASTFFFFKQDTAWSLKNVFYQTAEQDLKGLIIKAICPCSKDHSETLLLCLFLFFLKKKDLDENNEMLNLCILDS